jgi:hypothetical protein
VVCRTPDVHDAVLSLSESDERWVGDHAMRGSRRARARRAMWSGGQVAAAGLLLVASVLVATTSHAGAAPTGGSETLTSAVVGIANRAIAYDSTRDVLLVAVDASVPTLGNSLIELDPHTGAMGRSVWVGSDPSVIAVSDDGTRAYVGLLGSPVISEIDLVTFNVTRTIALGVAGFFGPRYAEDIETQPGSAEVIAVSMQYQDTTPRHAGVAIIDHGVMRPNLTPGHTGSDRITWSDDPNVIYGYDNESSASRLYRLSVAPSGVSVSATASVIHEGASDIEHVDGRIQATNGQVVDAGSLQSAGSYSAYGAIEADPAQHKTFFLSGDTLSRQDTLTQSQDWTLAVPAVGATSLVDAGAGLAASGPNAVLLVGVGVTSSQFVVPVAPTSVVQPTQAQTTSVALAEIVASPDGAHVYGVARDSASLYPGEVVEVDTFSGAVTRHLAVGGDPHRIAISSDGSTLMVGHHGANKLTEIAVDSFTVRTTIPLGSTEWAGDIAAQPGSSRSFAVVLVRDCCSPSFAGVIMVDAGVIKPGRKAGSPGSTAIAFAGDASKLYGHNGEISDFAFSTMTIDANGIAASTSTYQVFSGWNLDLVPDADRIIASSGEIAAPSLPRRVGRVGASGQPVAIPTQDRLLMVSGSTINEYDRDGFWAVGSQAFQGGSAVDAVLAGRTVAIATTSALVLVPVANGAGAGFTSMTPKRLLDSRAGTKVGAFSSPWSGGVTRDVQVAGGSSGVPADAVAVALNVTVTGTTGASFLTVWPKGQARPLASSLNWAPGWTVPNAVTVKVGSGGMVSLYNDVGAVDVVVDVVGYYSAGSGSGFHPVVPTRVQDSRAATRVGPYATPWHAGTTRQIDVVDSFTGVPETASGVLMNVTVTGTSDQSFLTLWPMDENRPLASSHNWVAGWTIANSVIARVGTSGQVGVYNNAGDVHVVADLTGWFG